MKSISLKNRKIKLHKQCKQIVYDNYTVQWEPFARESSVSLQTSKIYMSSPTHTHNTTLHLFILNSTWMRAACKHSQVHIQIPMRIHAYSNQVQSSLAVILIVLSSSLFLFLNICIRSNGEGERESIIYKRSSCWLVSLSLTKTKCARFVLFDADLPCAEQTQRRSKFSLHMM